MKNIIIYLMFFQTCALGDLSQNEINYLLGKETSNDKVYARMLAMISKEDTFQWTELIHSWEEAAVVGRIVSFAAKKYEEYEEIYTKEEKNRLVGLIIEGVEKENKNRGYGYGGLSRIYRVDHPLVDDLIERLKRENRTDSGCKYDLDSLIKGLAITRAEKAARLKTTADQTPAPTTPTPQASPPHPASSPTRPPVPVQSPPAVAPATRLWPWLLAGGAVILATAVGLIRAARKRRAAEAAFPAK